MFLAVAAGIGDVQLIKTEDDGEAYYRGDDMQLPDYRVVASNGEQLLVEVKTHQLGTNFRDPIKFSDRYVKRLLAYARCTGPELVFAVYWEEPGVWTLNRLRAFEEGKSGVRQWSMTFVRAVATNEMAVLGDVTVATLAPIRLRLLFDPSRSDPMPMEGEKKIRTFISSVQLLSQNRPLDGLAAQIAWQLLWYGKWDRVEQDVHHEGDRLLWIDEIFGPPEWTESECEPNSPIMVGALSEMISRAYLRGAQTTIHTTATDEALSPGYMGSFIPRDFVNLKLSIPLYRFELQPNYDLNTEAT